MVLPALQVRVPNPANALLQAEQIKGARAATAERQRAVEQRNALLTATEGADLTTRAGQQSIVNALAGFDPVTALQAQLQINQANQPSPGFTLSPGGARFDAAGNIIAERPASGGGGFTLPAGSTRFDAQGNPIASVPATPPRPSQFDQRVSELMSRGFSQTEAQDIAANRVRISSNPVTGNTELINVATGEVSQPGVAPPPSATPAQPGTQLSPVLTADERGRLFNQNASIDRVLGLAQGLEESAASAAGPRGSLGALANTLFGFLGRNAPIPAGEIAAARQEIRLFNQIAKTAIVNNPRFPVAEQQVVEQMLPNANDFFANPSVEFNKVLQLQEFLRNMQTGNNASLGIAPAPQSAAPASTPTIQTQEEFDALPSGSEYINPDDGLRYRKP